MLQRKARIKLASTVWHQYKILCAAISSEMHAGRTQWQTWTFRAQLSWSASHLCFELTIFPEHSAEVPVRSCRSQTSGSA